MKKTICMMAILSSLVLPGKLYGQCKAEFKITRPQCSYIFENTSKHTYPFHWVVNGTTYYNNVLSFISDAGEDFNVCLYTQDTLNKCFDTLCRTVKGRNMKFDTYVYKQQLYITSLMPAKATALYQVSYGDNKYDVSGVVAVFKHTYNNPGLYKVQFMYSDTLREGNVVKRCEWSMDDTIAIDGNNKPRAFFISYLDAGGNDTILLFNRAVGENLKYYWDLGDGSSSAQKFPSHTYASAKKVNLCMTIVDTSKNVVSTYCDSVPVTPGLFLQVIAELTKPSNPGTNLTTLSEAAVSIYPNPVKHNLNVTLPVMDKEIQWEILGVDGQSLMQGNFSGSSTENLIQLDRLGSGLHILLLRCGPSIYFQKFLKLD